MRNRPEEIWSSMQAALLPERPRRGQVVAFAIPNVPTEGDADIASLLAIEMHEDDTVSDIGEKKFLKLNGAPTKVPDIQGFIINEQKGPVPHTEEAAVHNTGWTFKNGPVDDWEESIYFLDRPIAVHPNNVCLCIREELQALLPEEVFGCKFPGRTIEGRKIKVLFASREELKALRFKLGKYLLDSADSTYEQYKSRSADSDASKEMLARMETFARGASTCFRSDGDGEEHYQAEIRCFVAGYLRDLSHRKQFMIVRRSWMGNDKEFEVFKKRFEDDVRKYMVRTAD